MVKFNKTTKLDFICDEVRKRICIGEYQGGLVLHEERLAKEFKISRTPIRQVLHRLALERFVETKTGVGTLITPAARFDFAADVETCQGLLKMMADIGNLSLNNNDRIELAALHQMGKLLLKDYSPAAYWEACYRYNDLIRSKIDHDLIRDTFHILSCRIYRRILSDQTTQETPGSLFLDEMQQAQIIAEDDTANALLRLRATSLASLKSLIS